MQKTEKGNLFLAIGLGLLLAGLAGMWMALPLAAAKGQPIATLAYFSGPVNIMRADSKQWDSGKRGMSLYEDDQLKTGKQAQAVIFYLEGTQLRINANTDLNVGTKQQATQNLGGQAVRTVKLLLGEIWGKFMKSEESGVSYNIQTNSAVAAVKGTKMDTSVMSSGSSDFTVLEGLVQVSNNQGSVSVGAGKTTSVLPGNAPSTPKSLDSSNRNAWEAGMEGKTLVLKIKDKNGVEKEVKLYLQK